MIQDILKLESALYVEQFSINNLNLTKGEIRGFKGKPLLYDIKSHEFFKYKYKF